MSSAKLPAAVAAVAVVEGVAVVDVAVAWGLSLQGLSPAMVVVEAGEVAVAMGVAVAVAWGMAMLVVEARGGEVAVVLPPLTLQPLSLLQMLLHLPATVAAATAAAASAAARRAARAARAAAAAARAAAAVAARILAVTVAVAAVIDCSA